MKFKIASFLLAASFLAAAAWLVHAPTEAQAVAVPPEYRQTVQKGLDYLAGKQFKDGHWEEDGGAHPVALTGLAGLAMLMEIEDPFSGGKRTFDHKHSANVRKAADWLMAQSQPGRDGLLFSNHASETSRYMQGHGLATLFLAGVCRYEDDAERRKKLVEVLTRAVKYIASAQSTQGGWHDTSKVEGHDFASIPATVIQFQALDAAANVGVPVPLGALNDGRGYLKASLDKGAGLADPEAAAILACLVPQPSGGLGDGLGGGIGVPVVGVPVVPVVKAKSLQQWFDDSRKKLQVGKELSFGRSELAHYYLAQAAKNLGGDSWTTYRTWLFERLRQAQKADGSWPAGEGTCSGPVYATAVWSTILQLDNESHPSRRPETLISN